MWVFSKLVSKIPPAIFLAPIGIAFGYATSKGWIPVETLLLNERYPNLELSLFKISTEVEFSQAVILTGASVAFIAILETLISAKIAENLTKVRYNSRRELLGLALANIGSGLFGGLPATGVFVRTGLNVKSGATHRTSQILQSLFVGLISVLIFTTFTYIPLAIIASILIFAAVRMLEIRDMKKYWKYSKKDFAVAILVIVLMVAIDSVIGLLAGTVLALLFFVENFSKGHCDLTRNRNNMLIDKLYEGNFSKFTEPVEVVVYSFKGALTYVNGDTHKDRLHEKIDLFDTIILRMRDLAHIDHDGVEIFYEILEELKQKGKTVYITGLSAETKKALKKHDGAEHLKKVTVMANTTMALRALGFTV
jgi:SulP family sulfate permease